MAGISALCRIVATAWNLADLWFYRGRAGGSFFVAVRPMVPLVMVPLVMVPLAPNHKPRLANVANSVLIDQPCLWFKRFRSQWG
jgi:hypothetical protein